jgi:hypothetical protein
LHYRINLWVGKRERRRKKTEKSNYITKIGINILNMIWKNNLIGYLRFFVISHLSNYFVKEFPPFKQRK